MLVICVTVHKYTICTAALILQFIDSENDFICRKSWEWAGGLNVLFQIENKVQENVVVCLHYVVKFWIN